MTDTEMTRFLAEKCMGWRIYESGRGSIVAVEDFNGPRERERILEAKHPWDEQSWFPLSSISDAFQVAEKMRQMDKYVRVEISPAGKSAVMIWRRGVVFTARDDSPARAICLAAIAALEDR